MGLFAEYVATRARIDFETVQDAIFHPPRAAGLPARGRS
jgi:hypothetical protein